MSQASSLRVLAITKLFPNAVEPTSAPFNRQQFAALSRYCRLEVAATIPWFPGAGFVADRSSAGRLTRVPRRETIDGLDVIHPRTMFVPKMGQSLWAPLYVASLAPLALRWRGKFDVVLGAWAYPDGVASIVLARMMGVPAVVKLHGSDVNAMGKLPGPRRQLELLLPKAARVVAVSRGLGEEARKLGVREDRLEIVMNGVDAALFRPRDRAEARRALGLSQQARVILYVGTRKESKGAVDLVTAFERIAAARPELHLVLVGGGDAGGDAIAKIEPVAARWPGRITIAGERPLAEVPTWMAACDVLTLPSWAEGTPNVVMEALASGRRVVATNVGGIPDLMTSPELGELVPPRDPAALAAALERVALADYDPSEVARLGSRGSWEESAERLAAVLRAAAASAA